jgi:small subunit ribosomal protein S20
MPNSAQAKKRLRQTEKIRVLNRAVSSRMKTEIKKVMDKVEQGDAAGARAILPEAMKRIDKAAKRNIIHDNTAARKKSRLVKRIKAAE